MALKHVRLSEDAIERLQAVKREEESYSDVVRRITSGVRLTDLNGINSEDSADELQGAIVERRRGRDDTSPE